jgi:hypothetical protein
MRNTLFNVNELNCVINRFDKAMTQDSNQTAPIAAPHVSRSYPI